MEYITESAPGGNSDIQQNILRQVTTQVRAEPSQTFTITELTTIEKLQFKKFIAEQSGMNKNEVDNYIDSITDAEKSELIETYKSNKQTEIYKQNIQSQPAQSFIPIILF